MEHEDWEMTLLHMRVAGALIGKRLVGAAICFGVAAVLLGTPAGALVAGIGLPVLGAKLAVATALTIGKAVLAGQIIPGITSLGGVLATAGGLTAGLQGVALTAKSIISAFKYAGTEALAFFEGFTDPPSLLQKIITDKKVVEGVRKAMKLSGPQ